MGAIFTKAAQTGKHLPAQLFLMQTKFVPNITGNLFSRFCRIASGVSADRISRYYIKYDIHPAEPIKNDKKYRLKPGRVVVWLKCPRGACIFFSQSLHLKHRTISYFI